MRREQIDAWIAQGYNVLEQKKPKVVQGDIWEYLNRCDGQGTEVYALSELQKWSDQELAQMELKKYADQYGQMGEKLFLRNEQFEIKTLKSMRHFYYYFFRTALKKSWRKLAFWPIV
ncbi:hypothetical protein [Sphingobacterium multivorum]|uniref:hypothetical protein n=1 Tax=Sphingobacterium multivorum TaxID=28454 RepID=UPI0028A5981B|nr:hypothetical protein [Sphingobacterium multivorum]